MKMILPFVFSILFFSALSTLSVSSKETGRFISIEEALRILNSKANLTTGFESVGLNEELIDSKDLRLALSTVDCSSFSKLVEEQTDYTCIVGATFIAIIPKHSQLNKCLPIIERNVSIVSCSVVPISKMLLAVKGVRLIEGASYKGVPMDGFVSMEAYDGVCYILLNKMASGLGVKNWFVSDTCACDPSSRSPVRPVEVQGASVCFLK